MYLKRFSPYFKFLKPVRVQFALGLLAGIVYAASSGFGLPLVIKYLVPLVTEPEGPTGWKLLGILAMVPIVFVFRALGSFANAYLMAYTGMHVLEQIRRMVFEHIQSLPLAFFGRNKVGDLMSRVMGDTSQLQGAIVKVVDSLIKEPATLISAAAYLVYLSTKENDISFVLIALATVPACVLPVKAIGTRILKKAGKAQKQAGELNHVLNENLSATREVRAYNLEARESERFGKACRNFLEKSLKVVKYDKALTPLIEVVTSFAIVIALYVAVVNEVDEGALASILAALYMCYQPVKKLGSVSNTIRKAEASLDRLEFVLHTVDTVPETTAPQSLGSVKGQISMQRVQFKYTDDSVVLDDIQVDIAAGEIVALVGPSGAGKTTFANLVPRFYDVTEGSIRIDGIDVRDVLKSELRSHIALVSQEALLFSDSIANNIRIGKPDASLEEIKIAAEMANAHEFIEALDQGYETEVGERGSRLSGGQRQRISIARAFLKNAPIIILDEPTSALDAESEHQIQAALEKLSKGRTVLIIAHRFSTIKHADRILVFDAGKIVASGSHAELYPSSELYRSLYDKQAQRQ
ncbi:ABC transporter ATP-binding protein [Coraliomargarita sp. SDUM461003]|uniref:ABC transporter ATP-binding protein n=1 Tax=Thalassobacterium maritimum TaxID=3041265 RepID=A0ABU1AZH6_9BACT|nr:ABC transporter ATP-binding protein [Coraliomargarita sp. SDUM461003]MDQ8209530.1 ABC transporter ATP-binding protein [Coraliomargarita sp. SDUM461003]